MGIIEAISQLTLNDILTVCGAIVGTIALVISWNRNTREKEAHERDRPKLVLSKDWGCIEHNSININCAFKNQGYRDTTVYHIIAIVYNEICQVTPTELIKKPVLSVDQIKTVHMPTINNKLQMPFIMKANDTKYMAWDVEVNNPQLMNKIKNAQTDIPITFKVKHTFDDELELKTRIKIQTEFKPAKHIP